MELHKIEICNLNSLKGEFCIDFMSGQLQRQDIFAITGPTGSGKSTILDAITLALYNRVPRLDGKSGEADGKSDDPYKRLKPEDSRNSLSRETREGYAKVTFEASGKLYRAEWICVLKKKQFSGTHTLFLLEGEAGERKATSLTTGNLINEFDRYGTPKEGTVSQKVVELIGLGYDQFCKACILAQNSFANFLKADDYEKADILEKITGTSIYGRIADVIIRGHERALAEKKELDDKVSVQKQYLIADPAELARVKDEKDGLEKQKVALEEEIDTLKNGLQWWLDLEKLQNKKTEAEKNKKTAVERENLLLPDRKRLERHDKLDTGLQLLDAETDAERDLEHSVANVADANQRLIDNRESIRKHSAEKTEAEQDLAKKQSALAPYDWIKPVRDNFTFIHSEYGNLDRSVLELRNAASRHTLGGGSGQWDENTLLESVGQWTADLDEGLDRETAQQRLDTALNELALCESADTLARQMEQVLDLDTGDIGDNATIASLGPLQKELKIDVDALIKHINSLENKNIVYKRGLLVEGEPCELCGATHHPYATASVFDAEIDSIKRDLNEKMERLAAAEKEIKEATSAVNIRKGQRKALSDTINTLKSRIAAMDTSLQSIFLNYTKDAQIRELKTKASETEKWTDQKLEAEKTLSLVGLRDLLRKAQSHIDNLNLYLPGGWYAQRLADRDGYASALKTAIRRLNDAEKAVGEADGKVKEIVSSIETLTKLIPNLEEDIKKQEGIRKEKKDFLDNAVHELSLWIESFNATEDTPVSREELKAEKEDKTDWNRLRQAINDAENARIKFATLFEQAGKELKSHQNLPDRPSEDKQKLDELKNTAIKMLKDPDNGVEQQLNAVAYRLTRHEDAEAGIAAYKDSIAAAEKQVKLWNRFYFMLGKKQDSGSKEAREFRMIAQNYTLGLLLDYANQELRKFTRQRYLLKKQNDTTLEIMVLDGELGERYASSLSGGETFMVSLALALGLSNISSGSVSIKNLFIDEGFGSLDNDTQKTVISVLNQLRTQGKRIGIISHTAALLEDDSIYKISVKKAADNDKFSVIECE